ncbi:hypothetical protein RV11_GL001531 [Enterococcus phoeniculicola]|nr:hypothetical protein RV11_GL001531 [Enterococcus phoeniculicola]
MASLEAEINESFQFLLRSKKEENRFSMAKTRTLEEYNLFLFKKTLNF